MAFCRLEETSELQMIAKNALATKLFGFGVADLVQDQA